ncbi:MAG: SRPBCC family protein [Chloroflexota bacterium]|nr:SRPBCC family protein [Chloroflexota bacterium]
MPHIEESIDIAASPTVLFRFCHDAALRPKWDERVVSVELITPKPVRTGTLLSIDACHSSGPVFSWEAEYVGFQFPSRSKLRVIDAAPSSWFSAGNEEWQFKSVGGGAQFTLVWDYEPRGLLGRVLDKLGRRASMQRAIKRSLANLKTMVEAG